MVREQLAKSLPQAEREVIPLDPDFTHAPAMYGNWKETIQKQIDNPMLSAENRATAQGILANFSEFGVMLNQLLTFHSKASADIELNAKKQGIAPNGSGATSTVSADFQKGGFSTEEAQWVVERLNSKGVDLVELSGGSYESPELRSQKIVLNVS